MKEIHLLYIEHYFTLLAVTFLIGNPIEVLIFGNSSEQFSGVSNNLESSIKILIYGISFCFILINWKRTLYKLIIKNKIIWLILILVFIILSSFLWSSFPEITIRRSFLCCGSALFGIYLGVRYNLEQQINFLTSGFRTVMLMSLFFGIALPHYGIMNTIHAGAWCGIFSHKNGLGYISALSSILFLILLLGDKKDWKKWLMFSISVILLILAKSSTSLLTFLAVSVSLFLYRAFRLHYNRMIPALILAFLALASVGIFLVGERESLANLLGKDLTLTGRTELWPLVWDAINQKPWLGYGYDGFWWPENSESFRIWVATGWRPTHPHNGLLKILIEIGWIGSFIFLLAFILTFLKSLFLLRSTKDCYYYWPIAFLSFIFLTNLTESGLIDGGIAWTLFISVSLL